jgi:hypothetical protein
MPATEVDGIYLQALERIRRDNSDVLGATVENAPSAAIAGVV